MHQVVAEVVDAAAAVLLGHGHAEEAAGAGLGEQLAVDDAGALPRARGAGTISLSTNCRTLVAEELVLLLEDRAAHARSVGRVGPSNRVPGESGSAGLRGQPHPSAADPRT